MANIINGQENIDFFTFCSLGDVNTMVGFQD